MEIPHSFVIALTLKEEKPFSRIMFFTYIQNLVISDCWLVQNETSKHEHRSRWRYYLKNNILPTPFFYFFIHIFIS